MTEWKMMLRAGAKKKWTLWSHRLFSYMMHILCMSLPDWYFLVYTIYYVYTITSQTSSKIHVLGMFVSEQNEKSHFTRNATQLPFVLLQIARVTFLLLLFSLCFRANFLRHAPVWPAQATLDKNLCLQSYRWIQTALNRRFICIF